MTIAGYARTSTIDQQAGLLDQIETLKRAGCERLWFEHASAVQPDRPELRACLDWLREGDTFVVTRPDRLARSVRSLLSIIDDLRARDVTVRILSIGADTSTATGKLILTVLAGVAEMEREIMLERQRAGIEKARRDGKYTGRKPALDAARLALARERLAGGESKAAVAHDMGISQVTLWRYLNGKTGT